MELEATLDVLRAYLKSDPNFKRALEDYVDAEASLKKDPAEGQRLIDVTPTDARPPR